MSISEEWIEAFQLGDTKKVKQYLYRPFGYFYQMAEKEFNVLKN